MYVYMSAFCVCVIGTLIASCVGRVAIRPTPCSVSALCKYAPPRILQPIAPTLLPTKTSVCVGVLFGMFVRLVPKPRGCEYPKIEVLDPN